MSLQCDDPDLRAEAAVSREALEKLKEVARNAEIPLKRLMGWDIKKGRKEAATRLRSDTFTCQSPWKIECRTRVARDNGHLIIRVFRKGEATPFSEAIRISEGGIRRGHATIEEAGTFFVEIDAKTVWWWAHIDVPDLERIEALEKLNEVARNVESGKVWAIQRTARGFTWDWMQTAGKSKAELAEMRDRLEALYDAGSPNVPGGDRGARMMLRLLARQIGPNRDPTNALQIRVYCVFPTIVDAPWQDKEGNTHRYQHEIKNPTAYAEMIRAQMQDWANKLFRISGGKFALDFKVAPADSPITKFRRSGDRYWVSPDCVRDIVKIDPRDVTCFVFWIPTDGPGFPPKDCNACYTAGDIVGSHRSRAIFCMTTEERLARPGGWTGLGGGLPHEFWHFTQSLLRASGFKGFIPSNHSADDWQRLCDEMRLQGIEPPGSQYEDLYPIIMSWRTVRRLQKQHGHRPWGDGPQSNGGE
jgi:hypothetical protein